MKAVWQREKITPAGRADDTTFLRRIYIDLVGTIPTIDETRQFLKDVLRRTSGASSSTAS